MQRKLTLDPDTLQVASFEASPVPAETRGTVEAREEYVPCPSAGYPLSCGTQHTCASFDVSFNGVHVCRAGSPHEPRELVRFNGRDVRIDVDLNVGSTEATIWTNDLTAAYVHENSAYAT